MAAEDRLGIDVRHAQDRVLLCLRGELDMVGAPLLREHIERVEHDAVRMIVLDLQELQFMDSTGLRVILSAQERAEESGRQFAVTPGSSQIQRMLAITGVDDHLRIIASPDELVA